MGGGSVAGPQAGGGSVAGKHGREAARGSITAARGRAARAGRTGPSSAGETRGGCRWSRARGVPGLVDIYIYIYIDIDIYIYRERERERSPNFYVYLGPPNSHDQPWAAEEPLRP
jgi:hypothetical protein